MSDSFEQLVISRLDDLKNDSNRNFDLLVSGQRALHAKFEEHAKEDTKRFESIDAQFATAATIAAEAKGVAKTTAKVWGICTGLTTPIVAAIWAVWKAFHRIP